MDDFYSVMHDVYSYSCDSSKYDGEYWDDKDFEDDEDDDDDW